MKPRFDHEPLTFSLSTNPSGTQAYRRRFDKDQIRCDVFSLVSHVRDSLDTLAFYLNVYKSTLTLINITSRYSQTEVGKEYLQGLLPRTSAPVTITLRMRDRLKKPEAARLVNRVSPNVLVWGSDGADAGNYVTIEIPVVQCARMRLPYALPRELNKLYSILGAFTKGYLVGRTRSSGNMSINGASLKHMSLHQMMYRRHPDDWPYNIEMWDKAPYFLQLPKTEVYANFFLANLIRFYRRYDEVELVGFYDWLEAFVRSKVLADLREGSLDSDIYSQDVESKVSNILTGDISWTQ